MTDDSLKNIASTAQAISAEAQSREKDTPILAEEPSNRQSKKVWTGLGTRFVLGKNVERIPPIPLKRQKEDPLYRPLRIFALDPAISRLEGSIALINVPYEPLEPGPVGRFFKVDNYDGAQHVHYCRVDLDDKALLIKHGQDPTPSDPRFHQQMVYAVCSNVYSTFRSALGRQIAWGFERKSEEDKLYLRPHAFLEQNAYYDEKLGELCFGYYRASENQPTDRTLPGGFVFTCLSHDIIAHELTHAILDGLRSSLNLPSGPDVIAFHEAFADLVALFQHFSYREVVIRALATSGGRIEKAKFLTDLAHQFGHSTGKNGALRSSISTEPPKLYNPILEPHELGEVLVSAIFEAFLTVYKRKTERYIRLATQGSGILPKGELPVDLQNILADEASKLASQFLSVLIRAIDYCPPVDLRFGEYLRAIITADYDLVPDDVWGYREALIDAFLRRMIYPRYVSNLSEDSLLWRSTRTPCGPVTELDFAHLQFQGDPASAAGPEELRRQACVLGEFVSRPEYMEEFGLVAENDPRLEGAVVDLPSVESIRSARRVGPDGQVVFDLVAEITQRCRIPRKDNKAAFEFYGGVTVILGPEGEVRYAISKSVVGKRRQERRLEFLESPAGQYFWKIENGKYVLKEPLFKWLHFYKYPS
ncbi:hypothetical protein [Nitrosomonas communis]|uniref:Peptidase M4 n=1 Tax=Nitrosomonas communis TaxID=44574 RepID=A0A1I4RDH5_9PROT|nr:hypothetical protein [Nitrosomonas communis]SFM50338.1 hypothetical protein SAMN05421863_103220 [Nitrosomonas communis]